MAEHGVASEETGGGVREPWEPMQVNYVGHLATVMQAKVGSRPDGIKPPKE